MSELAFYTGELPGRSELDDEAFRRMFGLESELGGTVNGHPFNNRAALNSFIAADTPAGLYVHPANGFLSNGGRFYLDINDHIEYATPECRTLRDLGASAMAGFELVKGMFTAAVKRGAIKEYEMNTRVVDYHPIKGQTWGSHENYLVPRWFNPTHEAYMIPLATHLATNTILSGAGAIRQFAPDQKFHYLVSQRLPFIGSVCSDNTTQDAKPLINLRDEPHADDDLYRRLHLIHGDPTMTPWATTIGRFGGTAIMLRLLEYGVDMTDLQARRPVRVAHQVARDVRGQQLIELDNERRLRAVDIQLVVAERLLQLAEVTSVPVEEVVVAEERIIALDAYKRDQTELVDRVEHIAKRHLIEQKMARAEQPDMIDKGSKAVINIDFLWGELGVDGIALKLNQRRHFADPLGCYSNVRGFHRRAPAGRAALRAEAIRLSSRNGTGINVNWDGISYTPNTMTGTVVAMMNDPYGEDEFERRDMRRFVRFGGGEV